MRRVESMEREKKGSSSQKFDLQLEFKGNCSESPLAIRNLLAFLFVLVLFFFVLVTFLSYGHFDLEK